MTLVKWIFVILHVITAAGWFGLGLRLAGQARKVIELGGTAGEALADDAARSVRLMNIFVVLTLLFGLGAFFAGGGFAVYGPVYHTSLLLIVVLAGIQLFLIRPQWHTLQAALGGEQASETVRSARSRVSMGVGIGHLIWLVLLVLMFWNRMGPAL